MSGARRRHLWRLVRLPYRGARALLWLGFDRLFGVDTTFFANEFYLGRGDSADWHHQPCGWLTLWRIFRRLAPGPDDVLLDVGCGNGRVLLVASRFTFKRLVGIELSERLCAEAERNLAGCRLPIAMPVAVINADAARYPLSDDASIVFLYHPFEGEIFDAFLVNLLACVDRRPRRLRLVYCNPVEQRRLEATGRFRLLERIGGLRPTARWSRMVTTCLYEVLPAAPAVNDKRAS